jgi:hypothetical protein
LDTLADDINGDGVDDLTTPFTEDASYGAAFDPKFDTPMEF